MTNADPYEDFEHFVELVPGVFVDEQIEGYTAVHFVDSEGESATWNSDEVAEDPSAFIAAITAVALAAKHKTAFVRTNIKNKGQCVADLIAETKRYVDNMLPMPDHKFGYTQPLVNEILAKRGIETATFWTWMHHQTVGVSDDGGKVVYPSDLINFLVNGESEATKLD
jgi:hypothetical protein